MSVYTTADGLIDEAKKLITDATKKLITAMDDDTQGSTDYNDDYIEKIFKIICELSKLKKELNG